MKTIKRKVFSVVCLAVLLLLSWYIYAKIIYHLELPLYQIASCLRLFIRENHEFPQNQEDLIKRDYLKIENINNQKTFYVRCDIVEAVTRVVTDKVVPTSWSEVPFMKYDICYGATIDNLLLEDGVLYDISSKKATLLIHGLHNAFLSRTYSEISTELYYELKLSQEKLKVSNTVSISAK